MLTVLITHLDAPSVERQLAYMRALAPAARVVVAHGGRREDFDRLRAEQAVFIDDPTLRGPAATAQSGNQIVARVHASFVADDPSVTAVLLLEFDQVVLREGYDRALLELLDHSGADVLGKNLVLKDSNNWIHAIRARRDPGFVSFLDGFSERSRPLRLYGCLGSGIVLRRAVLERFTAMRHHSPSYIEMYLPTVAHHLGFEVADLDRVSDIYDYVRYAPPFSLAEARKAKREGHFFVHPYKELDRLDELLQAPGPSALAPSNLTR